ncbi:MAG: NAD(P)-binding domain-containing protein [Enterobacterales bacterium]|nr:NAD(P)-binding domain-containing protein [Enterobacterales bacterium]
MAISAVYGLPLLIIFGFYLSRRKTHQRKSTTIYKSSVDDGLTEAMSLHPIIDPMICIGCGSCVSACPEKNVLGIIDRKAQLIQPANCIGHGACKTACPENAIKLVFGSKTRGVEIPDVHPDFQSSVPGLYIAGELGGMGLIRNAIEQGRQAMEFICKEVKASSHDGDVLDCLIIGAGPAGLSAALGAKEASLNYVVIDQETTGGTVAHFPKGKLVMTQAATIPLVGKVNFGEIHKEDLMKFWIKTIGQHDIKINEQETLINISHLNSGLHEVETSKTKYVAKTVLLAIGRRGSPRKLNIPGEDLSKVVYRMVDPADYLGKDVLIVGGGDSAIEAACDIADLKASQSDHTSVTLSYRKEAFARLKSRNRERIAQMAEDKKLDILFATNPKEIFPDNVHISRGDEIIDLANQAVIVCAGGILPTGLLKQVGVKTDVKYGEE